ncbi:mandelate racemase/muconate lactonizing enzyme family protein [Microlunatus panaciterrae]|uniref:L-alanine-DL-glutamate epimerase-like enolase superfamily enzyme n=1 Tax=Microlunatus panaciterrae TaxID=400768 RepID=A0ABS2RHF9_9ACTN|nr:mandelate racemase/muconate lactonizing enzyme family protein [Microlunatus panaciterrae]MBM7798441.1 L-alanine-DL-glutamate epimerase-like enolase superfamily enzyme [Microlunatus panaciterrae]
MIDPVIEEVRTRLLTAKLPRPWGPGVSETHLLVVEVHASDGSTGTGFSWTPTIGPQSVQALLDNDIRAFALGQPAHPAVLWDRLWTHLHEAGGGGVTSIAIGGLDLALWDLQARAAGRSVTSLIGRQHQAVTVYGSGVNLHYELDELTDQAHRWVAAGYPGVKMKVGSPDLSRDVERVAAVRRIIGPGRKLMIDANQRWDLPSATRAMAALEPFDLHWIEEPFRADDTAAYIAFRQRTRVPIAAGENVHHVYRFRDLITAGAIDVVQPNIIRVGGITPFLRIAQLARGFSLQLAPHLLTDLSAQLAAVLPERVWVEEVEDTSFATLGLVTEPTPVIRSGEQLIIDERPGLGFSFAPGAEQPVPTP